MGIIAKHVGKQFGDPAIHVLTDISFEISDGEFVSLAGRSGAGKSTLLYILSSLDNPTEGNIEISGQDITKISDEDLHRFRNQNMGFIFQFNYLIAELTAIQNILMPARKYKQEQVRLERAKMLLEQFGLLEKMNRYPRQLSGGEQQRLAIARSLIMEPKYLFADEPTGSLDTANAETVMNILKETNLTQKTTVLLVTHDPDYAAMAPRQIRLADGKIVFDSYGPTSTKN